MKKPFRDQIQRFPAAGSLVPEVPEDLAVRQAPIKGFPYHVIYLETADTIHLLAFAKLFFPLLRREEQNPPATGMSLLAIARKAQ